MLSVRSLGSSLDGGSLVSLSAHGFSGATATTADNGKVPVGGKNGWEPAVRSEFCMETQTWSVRSKCLVKFTSPIVSSNSEENNNNKQLPSSSSPSVMGGGNNNNSDWLNSSSSSGGICKLQELDQGGRVTEGTARFIHPKLLSSLPGGEKGQAARDAVQGAALSLVVASNYATGFSKLVQPTNITFPKVHVLELLNRKTLTLCTVETPLPQGQFVRHTGSTGEAKSTRQHPTAFSHYSYEASRKTLVITRLQGVDNTFCDPQIHSADNKFGLGNLGKEGIRQFLMHHECNDVCRKLGLPHVGNNATAQQPSTNPNNVSISSSSSSSSTSSTSSSSSSTSSSSSSALTVSGANFRKFPSSSTNQLPQQVSSMRSLPTQNNINNNNNNSIVGGSLRNLSVGQQQQQQKVIGAMPSSGRASIDGGMDSSISFADGIIRSNEIVLSDGFCQAETVMKFVFDAKWGRWSKQPSKVRISPKPFNRGENKTAFKMLELSENAELPPNDLVAKFFIRENLPSPLKDQPESSLYYSSVVTQMTAALLGNEFNERSPPLPVTFLDVSVVQFVDRPGHPVCIAEPFLNGEFVKHNDIFGAIRSKRMTPQAFSHFTYENSHHEQIVLNLEGVEQIFTSPCIHSLSGQNNSDYTSTSSLNNHGKEGILRFLSSHTCNGVCMMMDLPRFHMGRIVESGWAEDEKKTWMQTMYRASGGASGVAGDSSSTTNGSTNPLLSTTFICSAAVASSSSLVASTAPSSGSSSPVLSESLHKYPSSNFAGGNTTTTNFPSPPSLSCAIDAGGLVTNQQQQQQQQQQHRASLDGLATSFERNISSVESNRSSSINSSINDGPMWNWTRNAMTAGGTADLKSGNGVEVANNEDVEEDVEYTTSCHPPTSIQCIDGEDGTLQIGCSSAATSSSSSSASSSPVLGIVEASPELHSSDNNNSSGIILNKSLDSSSSSSSEQRKLLGVAQPTPVDASPDFTQQQQLPPFIPTDAPSPDNSPRYSSPERDRNTIANSSNGIVHPICSPVNRPPTPPRPSSRERPAPRSVFENQAQEEGPPIVSLPIQALQFSTRIIAMEREEQAAKNNIRPAAVELNGITKKPEALETSTTSNDDSRDFGEFDFDEDEMEDSRGDGKMVDLLLAGKLPPMRDADHFITFMMDQLAECRRRELALKQKNRVLSFHNLRLKETIKRSKLKSVAFSAQELNKYFDKMDAPSSVNPLDEEAEDIAFDKENSPGNRKKEFKLRAKQRRATLKMAAAKNLMEQQMQMMQQQQQQQQQQQPQQPPPPPPQSQHGNYGYHHPYSNPAGNDSTTTSTGINYRSVLSQNNSSNLPSSHHLYSSSGGSNAGYSKIGSNIGMNPPSKSLPYSSLPSSLVCR